MYVIKFGGLNWMNSGIIILKNLFINKIGIFLNIWFIVG